MATPARLVLVLALLLGACAQLVVVDGGLPSDGGARGDAADATAPDGSRDAGPDAAVPPVHPGACALGPRLGPYVSGPRPLAYSLQQMDDGEYLLGYAVNGVGQVGTLDADLGALTFQLAPDGEAAAAVRLGDLVVVQVDGGGAVDVLRVDASRWEATSRRRVCVLCRSLAVGARPLFDGSQIVVVHENDRLATIWSDEPRLTDTVSIFGGVGVAVAARDDGGFTLVASYLELARLGLQYLGPTFVIEGRVDLPELVPFHHAPGVLTYDRTLLLVGRADAARGLRVVRVTNGSAIETFPLEATFSPPELDAELAEAHGIVAMTIEGHDATEVLALRRDDLSPVLSPTVLADETGPAPTPRQATIAPHPEGFAIVYGAWHRDGGYGLYGRVLRCDHAP